MTTEPSTTPGQKQAQIFMHAASIALPISPLDVQAAGSRTRWGSTTRPGRANARVKAIRCVAHCASIAAEADNRLSSAHIETALKSMCFRLEDLLIDRLTGQWTSPKKAVRHRLDEIAAAILELARNLYDAENWEKEVSK